MASEHDPISLETRRDFLRKTAYTSALIAAANLRGLGLPSAHGQAASASGAKPWYRTAARWGQTNIVEIDPLRYDIAWWRHYWKSTKVQGVVVNGGGIMSYYPTEVPYHRKSKFLGDRDLLGELVAAAHEDGLSVFVRMDANRADQEFYDARPDWFAHDLQGEPYRRNDLPIACVNSPYYDEHITAILREIATSYRPEGFTDNNWNGPMRDQPCFCDYCQRSFKSRTGSEIPQQANWDDPLYREWIMWNYDRRLEIWDMFNAVTREAGGSDCIWVGMMAGSQNWQSRVFRDDREVYRRAEMIMLDDQRRFDDEGFMHNAEIGKRLRSVGGWDKMIPESMAMYHLTEHNFRHATKPEPEVRMWMVEGFAGGVQPWWHHVGADQHDRRMFHTAKPLMEWHEANEEYLLHRRPIASVGLLWSQRNMDFFGRDKGGAHVDEPWNGLGHAMVRDRIPYVPVHLDDIEREAMEMKLLILPNLGAMSDEQVAAVRGFVEAGGNLLATGASSLFNEWGDARRDFALADLFGASIESGHGWFDEATRDEWATGWQHTYLRLYPELRGTVYGPKSDAPELKGTRHPILSGFEGTDILAFGGMLGPLKLHAGAQTPIKFVPPSPVSPVESVYMHETTTDIPALVLNELPNRSRVAYIPADVDRRFSKENLPDHGDLLANVIRWTVKDDLPIAVEGAGLIDCNLYKQPNRMILHVANLTSAGTWRTPVHELIDIGPLQLRVRILPEKRRPKVRSIVSNRPVKSKISENWIQFELPSITDHEVLVIE